MALIDSHAHIHFEKEFPDVDEVLERAYESGIETIINVGVNPEDSRAALKLARKYWKLDKTGRLQPAKDGHYPKLFATAGLHPHEASMGDPALDVIHDMAEDVIAIGECGLDYFKNHSSQSEQDRALRSQIDIALEHNLPMVFHVRDAWDDFFAILRDNPKVRGVIHSFTGHEREVDLALEQGRLCFGLNGIMTFTKDEEQLKAARKIPLDHLILETDCPYLTPAPHRGKRNEPGYVGLVNDFLATLRGEDAAVLAQHTTQNTIDLFSLDSL